MVVIDTLATALIVWGAVVIPTLAIEWATRGLRRRLRERLTRPRWVGQDRILHFSSEGEGSISMPDERAPLRRIEDLASDLLIRESGCKPPQRRAGRG
jgi:hypothetical protein